MPSPICDDFKLQDPGAYAHCVEWLPKNETRENLDIGTTYTDYAGDRHHPQVKVTGASDNHVSPQEYYQWVINTINSAPYENLRMALSLKEKTGIKIPYLFTDYNSTTKQDEAVLERVREFVRKKDEELRESGLSKGSREYNIVFVLSIKRFVEFELHIKVAQKAPTLSAARAVGHETNCHGISNPYYGIYLFAGLNPQFFTVEWNTSTNDLFEHTRVGIYPDPNKPDYVYVSDPSLGFFGSPPNYQIQVKTSPLNFIAHTYYNELEENPEMSAEEKRKRIELALRVAPDNYRVLLAALSFYETEEEWPRAVELFAQLLTVYPYPGDLKKWYPQIVAHQ